MFHDRGGMRPDTVSGQAFALAMADAIGGRVLRLMGGADDGTEVEIAFAAILDDAIHDGDGTHKASLWMDRTAIEAGHADFWSYEIVPAHDLERLRTGLPDAEMETARLLAALALAGKAGTRASVGEAGR